MRKTPVNAGNSGSDGPDFDSRLNNMSSSIFNVPRIGKFPLTARFLIAAQRYGRQGQS